MAGPRGRGEVKFGGRGPSNPFSEYPPPRKRNTGATGYCEAQIAPSDSPLLEYRYPFRCGCIFVVPAGIRKQAPVWSK